MGYGDELMASGLARGLAEKGKRAAFGDGKRIIWHQYAHELHFNNPNIAQPGSEGDDDLIWIQHYPGKRPYNQGFGNRWLWITGHNNNPGQVFFDDEELSFANKHGSGFILIEPNVPAFKTVGINKQWPHERYAEVAHHLVKAGHEIVQFQYPPPYGPGHRIQQARQIKAPSFRHALAVLANARLYIGPEGGLHHGSAAVETPAVVIFGGFISPNVTGYSNHTNLYVGGPACGSFHYCEHCRKAMHSISVSKVYDAAMEKL